MAHICKTSLYCAKHYYIQCVISSIRRLSCLKNNFIFLKRTTSVIETKFLSPCTKFNIVKYYKYSTAQNDDEFVPEIDTPFYENPTIVDDYKENDIRSILYPESYDPIINDLKKCTNIQDVMDIINNTPHMNHQHICQTILIFWDLQKSFHTQYVDNLGKFDTVCGPEKLYMDYVQELKSHETFVNFLKLLVAQSHVFKAEELMCTIYYLKKLGYTLDNPIMNQLINLGMDNLENNPNRWNLNTLERLTNSIKSKDILRFAYLAVKPISYIVDYLKTCQTSEDFKLITDCFHNIHIVVSMSLLEKYKKKCMELIKSDIITNDHIDTIISAIDFLNLFHWSRYNTNEIIFLCKYLEPSISKMNAGEIITLHKVFQAHYDPASIVEHIKKKVTYLLEEIKYDDRIKAYLKLPDLLYCQITTSSPSNRLILEKFFSDLIKTTFPTNLIPIYNSLRCLKLDDSNVCKMYWQHVSRQLVNNNNYSNRLLQLCYKYMYFNNNVSGMFRSNYFEDTMLNKLYFMIEQEDASYATTKFSRMLSFILAYGLTKPLTKEEFIRIEKIANKLEDHSHQLDHLDYFILSRGIQLFNELNFLRSNDDHIYKLVSKVDRILDNCSNRFLKESNLNLNDLNVLCKSYINRRSNYENSHFHSLVYKYNFIKDNDMTARLIKQASYNFITTNTYIDKFINQVQEFVADNHEIYGDVAQKILKMCFMSGNNPKNEMFFTSLINILKRDRDIMNGLTLLNYCVALAYYGHLTDDLVEYVFSLDFLERLDLEIGSCYAKKTYPSRMRLQMMILNRIVCLDYPQHEIPWFHQKYIEEFAAYSSSKRSLFGQDVHNTLVNLTGNIDQFNNPHFTPYGYKVDFYLEYDKDNQFVNTKGLLGDSSNTKVAILLLTDSAFGKIITIGDDVTKQSNAAFFARRKNGSSQLRSRHLEQLGYKVIEISHSFWNSMYMAEPDAKINYLRNKLR